jgi:chromosome segregation and condensation protein ScpB
MKIYDQTPLSLAITKLFDKIKEEISRQYPSLPAGQVKAYIFGGAAVHVYTNARYSADIDAQLDALIELSNVQDILIDYEDENGRAYLLAWDGKFNDAFMLIHPDYREDAIVFQEKPDSPLWIYLASPVDVAVSKVSRFVDIDKADIRLLAEMGLITENEFAERVEKALLYWVGNDFMLKYNIRDAKKIIRDASCQKEF